MNHSDRSDVFISYRRVDKTFVQQLDQAIKETGREVWVDWEDIPPGSTDFNEDIMRGIEGADTFIAVLSPEYLKSPYTLSELDHAAKLHKRLVPLVLEKFDSDPDINVPSSISHINWVYFTPHVGEENTFDDAFPRLVQALEVDVDHVRLHTRYLMRARMGRQRQESQLSTERFRDRRGGSVAGRRSAQRSAPHPASQRIRLFQPGGGAFAAAAAAGRNQCGAGHLDCIVCPVAAALPAGGTGAPRICSSTAVCRAGT